ncbi:MAG: hypothetical protein IKD36_00760 [Clostridia bacterium]|nr:hypothetical protein [Clostridia bacterium]
MKKSNKVSLFYILSSVALLLVLIFGGVYGIYVSVGLNFMKQSVANVAGAPGSASNVSIGGTVNFEYSMVGVIFLSIALVVLSIFDLVSLIRQIVLFKQFKVVRESVIEKGIEKKVKSKKSVVFFAILLDVISIVVGVVGLFINSRSFVGNNYAWLFYVIDILIVVLALASLILLIIKLRSFKKSISEIQQERAKREKDKQASDERISKTIKVSDYDIDDFEYKLLKLKSMKNSKVITPEEYKVLRAKLLKENNFLSKSLKKEK